MNQVTFAWIIALLFLGGGILAGGYFYTVSQQNAPEGAMGINASPEQGNTRSADTSAVPSTPSDAGTMSYGQGEMMTQASGSGGVDVHAIPLGDGKVSSAPRAGYVYSCQTNFRGGGAEHAGDWIQGTTWDMTKKIAVQGSVSWPSATFSAMVQGVKRVLSGNGLPVGSKTGIFPIAASDPAYQYDRNPNSIRANDLSTSLSANPTLSANASCVPMGAVGYALNGVAIYNALDDAGRDAVAHEVQDSCDGHPQQAGQYHYHGPSDCMPHANEKNALVGYALDGFGIYSMYDANGNEFSNADLDACHGTTSAIEWNGEEVEMYHYVLTREYPYTIGCFRGLPAQQGQSTQGGGQGGTPPQEAITACSGKAQGASCSVGPGGGTCRTTPDGSFACVPQ